MQILQERFEAWMMALAPDRKFCIVQGSPSSYPGCLVVNFLRDNGMTMTPPPQGTSAGDRTAPPEGLPSFRDGPEYD